VTEYTQGNNKESGVFTVPCRAEPSRAAQRWLLHNVAVNTSRQRCQAMLL
jgi:hypothetical protein